MAEERDDLHRALESPDCYPPPSGAVSVVETHLSRLYFVGPRVYKVKKAVDLGFVDFSTLARRRHACDEEVRLNRRLAPDSYVGVVAIVRDGRGRVRVGAAGEAIEHAVEMERLPAAQMLDAKLERGEIDSECVERIVERLAEFHDGAERGPDVDRFAAPDAIARRVLGNLDEARAVARRFDAACGAPGESFPDRVAGFLRGGFERFLDEQRPRFEQRVREGRIREGHGDLHAGNLCVLPDRIVAFDCIEFSRELRCLDVAADLAFLLMDLDRLRFRAFARDLARRYAQRTGDAGLEAMLAFYKAHLACVRGKVAALRGLGSGDAAVRERSRRDAQRHFALAAGCALPPFLAATCGLPGSGKSFVSRPLALALDARHYQSDFERKRIARMPPTAPTPAHRRTAIYSREMTGRTYARLFGAAGQELQRGHGVILDATFTRASQRARAAALARELAAPFVLLHCRIDEAETRRRLAARAGERGQFSDADAAVYERVRARFEPPDEVPPELRIDLGADVVPEELVLELLDRVLGQLEAAGRLPATFPVA